jgi:two-component sensor histidine kinase/putative methionine-R-sulfoxide reductase with GAF domain
MRKRDALMAAVSPAGEARQMSTCFSLDLNESVREGVGQGSEDPMPSRKRQDDVEDIVILRQHQRVLVDLARFASESFDLQRFLDDASVRISAALEIDHVKILRYRRDRGDLFMEAGVGWGPGVVKSVTFAIDLASPVGRAFQTGRSVTVEDFSKAPDFRASEVLRAHKIVSLLNVPIHIDGSVWGVVEVDSTVLRGFSADTVMFMTNVAALISLAIRRADSAAAENTARAATAQEIRRREVLLSEMQHRVKNNFQTILSMIALRKPSFPTAEGRELAAKLADAIMAMALAHSQLSPTRAGEVVSLAPYFRALAAAFVASAENVVILVQSDDVNVPIEQAMPIGLIVNELITNSVKHAFGPEGGAIRVELHATGQLGYATLIVSDNGKGVAGDVKGGSGLKIINALTDQVRGELAQSSSSDGTTTTLIFPLRADGAL